ncbi:153_t:CDS:1 [Ambispora gerdemannii]|uniref:153_t:CDS:1 n=1 Tax=Ambispora gerdemannii TaxID=144530 RepID=A0A9N9F8B4_9GLOM|nr:153_t:CDS:1 [Ambispora gerdemannii]
MFESCLLASRKSNRRSILSVTLVITICSLLLIGGVFGEGQSLSTEKEVIKARFDLENSPSKRENNEDSDPNVSIKYQTTTVTVRETHTETVSVSNNNNNYDNHPVSSDHNKSTNGNPSLDTASSETNLLDPIKLVISLLYKIVIGLFTLLHWILTPVIILLNLLYTIFIWKPFTIIRYIISLFYPIYLFCFFAAAFGFFIGGTAGCFSEIIVGVLTDSSSERSSKTASVRNGMTRQEQSQLTGEGEYRYGRGVNDQYMSYFEQEQLRRQVKAKRRAAALANLRARNGGKLPEDLYERLAAASSSQLHLRALQQRIEEERQLRQSRPASVISNYSDASGRNTPSRFTPMQQRAYASSVDGMRDLDS